MAMTEAGGPHPTPDRTSHAARVGSAATSALDPAVWIRNWASQDWIAVVYLSLLLAALCVGKGPHRAECMEHVAGDLGFFLLVLVLVRGNVLRWGSLGSSLFYRVAIIGTLLATFFQLREILPAVSPWADDARIYAFDLRVFGFEPSVVFDQWVTPTTTEWFAFFYFLYFLILSVHVLPMVFWNRDPHLLNRFATGVLLLFMAAHLLYLIVPGYGPYWYLKDTFHHELSGGTFWPLVRETVDAGGAQKDIFPSLHTAAPTFFAIFSYRHRARVPFKYTWPLMAFVATQVIIATMFLRWHYLVDIVAGLALAFAAQRIGQTIADWERAKRERLGQQPVWMPLTYPWTRPED
jgi:hypothetical protein